ncbi:MAG: tyrosine-type recombinase/integrase [Acidimicrobiales bacterium]
MKAGPQGSTWTWQLTTGTKRSGNRRHFSRGGYPTKKDAEAALAGALAAMNKGDTRPLMRVETIPLGDYLEQWLDSRKDSLKPKTYAGYRDAIRTWIAPRDPVDRWRSAPHLGAIPMFDLGPDQILGLYAHLRERGGMVTKAERKAAELAKREPIGKPLGTRSVQLAHTILRMALADAAESGRLQFAPTERIPRRQRPKHTARNQADRFWTPEQTMLFLRARSDDRLFPLWATEIDTGARRGEQSGLKWEDLDLGAGQATIRENRVLVDGEVIEGTTKTSKTRAVRLDRRTVTALKRWKTRQAQERMAAGSAWVGGVPGQAGYLWTDELGAPYRPDRLSDFFEQAQAGLDLTRLVFHGLRHTSATIALARLVPVHVVSARLGHANVSITWNLYAHVIPGQDGDAAAAIGDAIYEAAGTEAQA